MMLIITDQSKNMQDASLLVFNMNSFDNFVQMGSHLVLEYMGPANGSMGIASCCQIYYNS